MNARRNLKTLAIWTDWLSEGEVAPRECGEMWSNVGARVWSSRQSFAQPVETETDDGRVHRNVKSVNRTLKMVGTRTAG